jgi:hypothetical protein
MVRIRLSTVVGASICDLCTGDPAANGVDPSSIHLYVNDLDVTEFSEIAPIYCMGYSITTYDVYSEPGDYFAV